MEKTRSGLLKTGAFLIILPLMEFVTVLLVVCIFIYNICDNDINSLPPHMIFAAMMSFYIYIIFFFQFDLKINTYYSSSKQATMLMKYVTTL